MARNRKKNPVLVAATLGTTTAIQASRPSERKRPVQVVAVEKPRRRSTRVDRMFPSSGTPPRSGGMSAVAAPSQQGAVIRGNQFHFSSAKPRRGLNGVRIRGRQLWCLIYSDGTHTNALRNFAGTGDLSNITFDPNDLKTMPPPVVTLSEVFGRYNLVKCELLYTPASLGASTTNQTGVGLAVMSDAALASSGNGPSSFQQILELSNSVSGPTWTGMSLAVPCDDELRYTFQSVGDSTLSVAEERQEHAFALAGQFDTTPAAGVYGYIHIDYTIDLYDVILPPAINALKRLQQKRELVEPKPREERKVQTLGSGFVLVEETTPRIVKTDRSQEGSDGLSRPNFGISREDYDRAGRTRASSLKG